MGTPANPAAASATSDWRAVLAGERTWALVVGDSAEWLRGVADCSVDAVVTDPPAGIGFMGKGWDGDRGGRAQWVAWLAGIMREVLRVLRPGGHALVWALPRTSHWTAGALEDAGFEIRDRIDHLFGSGFPKSLNVGEGRGTALKPAKEDWWLVRKPLDGTVAANVARHGTGAINIDGCRVGIDASERSKIDGRSGAGKGVTSFHSIGRDDGMFKSHTAGRWPPHLVFTHVPGCERRGEKRVKAESMGAASVGQPIPGFVGPTGIVGKARSGVHYADPDGLETVVDWACVEGCPVAELDRQSGERTSGVLKAGTVRANLGGSGPLPETVVGNFGGDTGTASRFFPCFEPDLGAGFLYTPKPASSEKNAGLSTLAKRTAGQVTGRKDGSAGLNNPRAGAGRTNGARNIHPTVKPLALMRWLCRLITPPGGVVLDPFAGSGTTLVAALQEGFRAIGCEQSPEYAEIARLRIEEDMPLFNRGAPW
jgi:hypothetical protein